MDMHGFSQRPLPPQGLHHPQSFSSAHPSASTPATHSPQHAPAPFQARPQHHQQAFFQSQNGQFAQGGGGGSGAMMPPSAMQLHTRAQQPPSNPYSTAPFSPALPSPAASAAQKYANSFSNSASPINGTGNAHASPYAAAPNSRPQQSPTHQRPMAAPPTVQPQPSQAVKSVPPSPVSPGAQARDKERVTLLLEINTELLQEICSLSAQGKSGHVGAMPPPKEDGKEELKAASKEYIDCMRRLQANLSYLAATAERAHKPANQVPPGPAIMSTPSAPPALSELYTKLQSLFPGWKGQQQQQKVSPGPNAQQQQQQQMQQQQQQQQQQHQQSQGQ